LARRLGCLAGGLAGWLAGWRATWRADSRTGHGGGLLHPVVLADLGQHALWQAGLDVPPGWRRRSSAVSRCQYLAAIEGSWIDMAPVTTRAARRAPPHARLTITRLAR
jgi:MbtH protein